MTAPQPSAASGASSATPAPAYTLKVGSLNVWDPGPPGREEALAGLMRQADVVLLQELHHGPQQLADLARRSGHPYHAGVESVGIASRFPLVDFRGYPVRRTPAPTPLSQWFKWRYTPFCSARIHLQGRTLHVFANHWESRQQRNRLQATEEALRVLTALPPQEAVIFGGDLNAEENHREVSALKTLGMMDAYYAVPGAEHCGRRIDFILFRQLTTRGLYEAKCHQPPVPTDHPFLLVELAGG
jgi:endonuclease/exonuclease/phosphatase (EEP) superfamily protein YafD